MLNNYLIQCVFDWFAIFVLLCWIGNGAISSRWYNYHLGWCQKDFFIILSDKRLWTNFHSCDVRSLIQNMDIMVRMDPGKNRFYSHLLDKCGLFAYFWEFSTLKTLNYSIFKNFISYFIIQVYLFLRGHSTTT